ncbi:MAG: hypothetical protein AAF389_05125 [Gemmatimonadota bacterium]
MDRIESPSRWRRAGVMAAVFGLGLVAGLAIGRSIEPAAANPVLPPIPTDPEWFTPDGMIAETRRQQMDEMAAFLKETLELDAEQEVAFDQLNDRVRGEMEQLLAETGPRIMSTVQGAALELRSILTEEQVRRLLETEMPMATPFEPRMLLGADSAGGR